MKYASTGSFEQCYNAQAAVDSAFQVIVEPVFGQMKRVRGLTQFLLRGLKNVAGEWKLWCLTHNLLKLFRYGSLQPS